MRAGSRCAPSGLCRAGHLLSQTNSIPLALPAARVPWVGADGGALGPQAGGSLGPAPGKLKRAREPLVCMEGTRNPHRGRTGAVPRRLVSAGQRVCATGQGRSCGVLWDSGLLPAPSLSSPRCAEHLRFAGRCWAKHGAEGRGSGCCCRCRDLGLPHLPSPVFIVAALLLAVPMTGSTLSRWPDRLCRYLCRAAGPRERCRYLRRAPGAVPVPLQGCRAPGAMPGPGSGAGCPACGAAPGAAQRQPPLPPGSRAQWGPCCRAPCAGRGVAVPCAPCSHTRVRGRLCPLRLLPCTPPLLRHLCQRVSGELGCATLGI